MNHPIICPNFKLNVENNKTIPWPARKPYFAVDKVQLQKLFEYYPIVMRLLRQCNMISDFWSSFKKTVS